MYEEKVIQRAKDVIKEFLHSPSGYYSRTMENLILNLMDAIKDYETWLKPPEFNADERGSPDTDVTELPFHSHMFPDVVTQEVPGTIPDPVGRELIEQEEGTGGAGEDRNT